MVMIPDEVDERCEPEELSARGYCPGEEGHQAEIDGLSEQELDGHGDDSCTPPARGDCTLEEPAPVGSETAEVPEAPPPPAELPETGLGTEAMLVVGLLTVAAGRALLRRC